MTVCVTLAREAGTGRSAGRIWVVRSIEPRCSYEGAASAPVPGRSMIEAWVSDEATSGLTLLTGSWITAACWRDLVAGRLVGPIDGRVPLLPADAGSAKAVLLRLSEESASDESTSGGSGSDGSMADGSRVLMEIRSEVAVTGGRAHPQEMLIEQVKHDPLIAVAERSLRGGLQEHGLAEVPAVSDQSGNPKSPMARSSAEFAAQTVATQYRIAESQPAIDETEPPAGRTEIRLKDVTGGQVGDHNQQFNTLVVKASGEQVNFENLLKRPGVARAVQQLQRDRSNTERRQQLLDELHDGDTWFTPAQITVRPGGSRFGDFLRRALFIDVRNIQVGDHTTQHNHFTYVASTVPSDVELLRKNPQLAEDLADHLCPRPGQERDAWTLRNRIEDALQKPQLKFEGRDFGKQYEGDTLGKVLEIKRTDAFTVGIDNHQVTDVHVKVIDLALPTIPAAPVWEQPGDDLLNPWEIPGPSPLSPDVGGWDHDSPQWPDRGQRGIDGPSMF